jgi:SAM-dependent methyltransferase
VSDEVAVIARRFQAIAGRILNEPDLPVDPWLHRYCGSTARLSSATEYVRHQTDLLALAEVSSERAVVIDAGCGFGFAMIVHALLGAQRVTGVELYEAMVSTVRAYLPLLPDDVGSRIEIAQGTVAEMPYEDGSADIVLSIEAISHYLDVDAFLLEAWRVLRPGGVLIIADGNNSTNPMLKRRAEDLWEAFESGPAGRTLHGHVVGVPYVDRRRQALADHVPEIDRPARDEIARLTAGYLEPDVVAAGRAYAATRSLPASPYRRGMLAIAPDGQAMERLFSPHDLARRLRRHGFRARAYGYWGGANGRPLLRAANRALSALSPLTMPVSRSFRVIGSRPGPTWT